MKTQEEVGQLEESTSSLYETSSAAGLQNDLAKGKVMGGLWAAVPPWVCRQVCGERSGAVPANRVNRQEEELDAEVEEREDDRNALSPLHFSTA